MRRNFLAIHVAAPFAVRHRVLRVAPSSRPLSVRSAVSAPESSSRSGWHPSHACSTAAEMTARAAICSGMHGPLGAKQRRAAVLAVADTFDPWDASKQFVEPLERIEFLARFGLGSLPDAAAAHTEQLGLPGNERPHLGVIIARRGADGQWRAVRQRHPVQPATGRSCSEACRSLSVDRLLSYCRARTGLRHASPTPASRCRSSLDARRTRKAKSALPRRRLNHLGKISTQSPVGGEDVLG